MIKFLTVWIALSGAIALGISVFRLLNNKEKWELAKTVAYGSACATIALLFLIFIVIAF